MSATCEWGHVDHLKDFSPLCQVSREQRLRLRQVQLQKVPPSLKPCTAGDNVHNVLDVRNPGLGSNVRTSPLEVQIHYEDEEIHFLRQN